MPAHRYLLLLGSNLAGPERVQQALDRLATLGCVAPLTPIERTPARNDASRFYYNALATLDCGLERETLRAQIGQIETGLGRERGGSAEVAIDIDLLATLRRNRWLADPRALEKREFAQTPARELLEQAAIMIDMGDAGSEG